MQTSLRISRFTPTAHPPTYLEVKHRLEEELRAVGPRLGGAPRALGEEARVEAIDGKH